MREVVLKPSKTKLILLLLVSPGFVAIGIAALNTGDLGAGGRPAAAIFSIPTPPRSVYLCLTPQGFYVRSIFRLNPPYPGINSTISASNPSLPPGLTPMA